MLSLRKLLLAALAFGLLCLGTATRAQAVPVTGNLNIIGTVRISSSTIDFLPPVGLPNGTFLVGAGSNFFSPRCKA